VPVRDDTGSSQRYRSHFESWVGDVGHLDEASAGDHSAPAHMDAAAYGDGDANMGDGCARRK